MSKVVAVRKDNTGKIIEYKLDDGTVMNTMQAVNAVDAGEIEGCAVFTARDGSTSIRSNRGQYGYALSELPEF